MAEGNLANHPALLVLEDGTLLKGIAFGHLTPTPYFSTGEVVFNTAMSGYQEILSDPSYAGQLITLTCPQIGNVGMNPEDMESKHIFAKGLIIRKLPNQHSNWRATTSLSEFLAQNKTLGIANLDTRYLTHLIREKGALNACLLSAPCIDDSLIQEALKKAKQHQGLEGQNLAQVVSSLQAYLWQEGGTWQHKKLASKRVLKVVAIDYGIKKNILRIFHDLGCQIMVVPYQTSVDDILALSPDGVFLSNGPGDPKACTQAIQTVKALMQKSIPMFGICLGYQLMALALGAKTFKMKFGHHGGNHPVQDNNQQVFITSQNHGFAVDEQSLPDNVQVTHRSLFDHTIQGLRHRSLPILGFQGHPEAGPGPNDGKMLFHDFMNAMKVRQTQTQMQTKDTVTE